MLSDGNTLLVHYRDESRACIECKKCVRDCPMGIDIRESPFQIECVHCGECIDSCENILRKLKKPGLIHYSWGVDDKPRFPWDAKRVVILLVVAFYASGLFAALSLRRPVLVRIAPDRATLYRTGADGRIYNKFRYTLANRSQKPAAVVFSVDHLPGAVLDLPSNPVALQPGQSLSANFEISAPAGRRADLVTHFEIRTSTIPEQVTDTFPMTFLAPTEAK
jgi:polyferredoxin